MLEMGDFFIKKIDIKEYFSPIYAWYTWVIDGEKENIYVNNYFFSNICRRFFLGQQGEKRVLYT